MSVATDEFLCARCARHQKTCCQETDVFVTLGDIERIAVHSGQADFFEFRPASDPAYMDQDHDTTWKTFTLRNDGTRRVLKQQANRDCIFLGERGCVLPLETRPLVCRLYPFDYTDAGLKQEPAPGCPVGFLRPKEGLMATLNMTSEDARSWHERLYSELRQG